MAEEIQKGEELKKKDASKNKKNIAIAIVATFLIIVIILAVILLINPKPEEFTYNGFNFKEIDFGGLNLYQTNMTVIRNNKPYAFNLTFRNDPRTLDYIPVNFSGMTKGVYLSFSPNTTDCRGNASMATFEVGQFLSIIGVKAEAAVTENSSNNTLPVRNCSNSLANTVIILKPFSNETRVYQGKGKNCIVLESKECYLVDVSERFILALLEKYRKPDIFSGLLENFSNKS